MKKLQLTLSFSFLFAAASSFAQPAAIIKDYIETYKEVAIEEMKRTGVPAAITLAQGIHETSAGQSVLVRKSNNHFGIKCKAEWKGASVSHDDDARGECFRKYESPIDSYKDHSDFLVTRSHYSFLFKLDPTDYEGWAHGLKKAGYATNPKYPQILIKLINDYNLQDYTLIAMGDKKAPNENASFVKVEKKELPVAEDAVVVETRPALNYPTGVFKINDTKVIYVTKGTSFLTIAEEHNIPLARLFEFNDMTAREETANAQLIYLQRKRKKGASEFHIVAKGETVFDIAQSEGIRIESLLDYNFLKAGMKPQAGEKLYLHYHAPAVPKLATVAQTYVSSSNDLAKATSNTVEKGEADFIVHTVQPKETVYSISKRYAVNQSDLVKWNGLEGMDLKTGQQLRIKKM